MRAAVILPDGRRHMMTHVLAVDWPSLTVCTGFGTFRWRDDCWRWVSDDRFCLQYHAPHRRRLTSRQG